MPLDYSSLLIAIGFAGACLSFTLFATWLSARTELFLLTWAVGALFLVANIILYAIYVASPAPWLAVLAFLPQILGFAVILGAGRQFRTRRSPVRLILVVAVPALLVALPGFLASHDAIGFVLANLVSATLLMLTAREYWAARAEAPGAVAGLSALYAVVSVSFLLCAVALVAEGQWRLGRAPDNWAENLNVIVGIAAVAGVGALSLALNQSRLARRHLHEARTDALTGLLNRRALFDLYRERDLPAFTSVVVFDLDGFKKINDTHGHAAGDLVLRRFSIAVTTSVRDGDRVARLGGEEFALVLPRASSESALDVAERIRIAFAAEVTQTDRGPLRCTVSAGVATAGPDGQPFEDVLRNADAALYAAKRAGRNRVVAEPLRLVG